MKVIYKYSDENIKVHSSYIKNKTMLQESEGAKNCDIYECNEKDFYIYSIICDDLQHIISHSNYRTSIELN